MKEASLEECSMSVNKIFVGSFIHRQNIYMFWMYNRFYLSNFQSILLDSQKSNIATTTVIFKVIDRNLWNNQKEFIKKILINLPTNFIMTAWYSASSKKKSQICFKALKTKNNSS